MAARQQRSTRGKTTRTKSNRVKVDFTGVESSGRLAEGRHRLVVESVELRTSENSGNDYLNWRLKGKGGSVFHTTSLQPNALWNLRNVLEALGLEVPDGPLELDPSEVEGLELGAEVEHEKYQGKLKSVILDVFPVSELDEEEEPEEEEEEPEEEEEKALEDLSYEDLSGMDLEELISTAKEVNLKVTPKLKRNPDQLLEALAEELGLEEEEEPEEEVKSKKSVSRRRTSGSLGKGDKVTFEDDGEVLEGKIKSVNKKENFAVVTVDGDDWEIELSDLTKA